MHKNWKLNMHSNVIAFLNQLVKKLWIYIYLVLVMVINIFNNHFQKFLGFGLCIKGKIYFHKNLIHIQ